MHERQRGTWLVSSKLDRLFLGTRRQFRDKPELFWLTGVIKAQALMWCILFSMPAIASALQITGAFLNCPASIPWPLMPAAMIDAVTCREPIGHWLSCTAAVRPPFAFQLSKNVSLSRSPIAPYQQSVENGGDKWIRKRMNAALLIYLKGSLKQEDLCWLQHFLPLRPMKKELTSPETNPNGASSRPLWVNFGSLKASKKARNEWCWSDVFPSVLNFK